VDTILKFWSKEIISRIASLIGTPIHMDKATTTGEGLLYARCFIEVYAGQNLPKSALLQEEEVDEVAVEVEYEWIPPMCSICSAFGHLPIYCPTKAVWKPKVNDGGVDGEVPDNAAIGRVDLGQGA